MKIIFYLLVSAALTLGVVGCGALHLGKWNGDW
jgi:hypothetical protein